MELIDFPITLKSYKEPVWFHFFSDIHRSAPGCDASKLRSDISKIAKRLEDGEQHFWLGGGDWCNAISAKDKRFDSSAVADEFSEFVGDDLHGAEARCLAHEFRKIREAGIGICTGNHEDAVARYSDFNPAVAIAEKLNLPYLGYSCLIRVRVTFPKRHTEVFKIYWHHGTGASRTRGAKLAMLNRLGEVVMADVYGTGHVHEIVDFPSVRLDSTNSGEFALKSKQQLFLNAGTYLKAYIPGKAQKPGKFNDVRVAPDYAEKKAYPPSVIGHNGFKLEIKHNHRGRQSWDLNYEAFKW